MRAAFSKAAIADISKSAAWIARDDRDAAERFRQATTQAARLIGEYPEIGSVRLEFAPSRFRFLVLRGFPYVLVYKADEAGPVILRVMHGSQDLAVLLADLPREPD